VARKRSRVPGRLSSKEKRELDALRERTTAFEEQRLSGEVRQLEKTRGLVLLVEYAQCLGYEPVSSNGMVVGTWNGLCRLCGLCKPLRPDGFMLMGQVFEGDFPDCPNRLSRELVRRRERLEEQNVQARVAALTEGIGR